jgi:selenocysteine lyase/cysteine desulfurase
MKTATKLLENPNVREAFPVLKDVFYLNVGTYGIMPKPALEAFQEMQAEFESRGVASNHTFGRKAEETRQRIADLIHASPQEIAFTRNATDGINLVLAGIDWQPGDEVITTTEEHEAMKHPLLYLCNSKGLKIKLVEVSPHAEQMLPQLEEAVSEKTRLVAMSLVTCETGIRLPAKEITQWTAERGLLSLLDGAQVSGAVPVDVQEFGCDFYASNGHKWLSGPKGTGFFYGKLDKLTELSPAHVGAGSLEHADMDARLGEPFHTGQRFEFGTRAWPLYAGLGASLERPFLRLLTPVAYEESSGLTSFAVEDHQAGEVSKELRERWNIFVRVIPHYNGIRISTAHFNNLEDVDQLMAALDQICG